MVVYVHLVIIFVFSINNCGAENCGSTADVTNCRKKTLAFEAIADLHSQLDGDSSGGVDFAEALSFLGDKLSYSADRLNQKDLSQEDGIISLLDLWVAWRKNPAHNWTTSETARWLIDYVELPEYVEIFAQNNVDGESIPLFVTRTSKYLIDELGIKNSLHRRKLTIKAMDLILFGPTKKNLSTMAAAGSLLMHLTRDMSFVSTLVFAGLFITTLIVLNHQYLQRLHSATSGNFDRLSKAEQTLQELQHELLGLKEAETTVGLKNRTQESASISPSMGMNVRSVQIDDEALFHQSDSIHSSEHISSMSAKHSRTEPPTRKPSETSFFPRRTIGEPQAMGSAPWSASPVPASFYIGSAPGGSERLSAGSSKRALEGGPVTELALLLQMTHELELRHYWEKRSAAAKQLMAAKEACDRVRKRRATLVGSVRLIHSDNLDDVDSKLNAARRVLENVTADMSERKHRWTRIEELTGLPLQHPADINALMTALGYDKSRRLLPGDGTNGTARLFDLSGDFSMFTGDEYVEDQPPGLAGGGDDIQNIPSPDCQAKVILQSIHAKLRADMASNSDYQYLTADQGGQKESSGAILQPTLPRNYSFVRPFATIWRKKAKSSNPRTPGYYGTPQSLSTTTSNRPQFSLDQPSNLVNCDAYSRKTSIS